MCVYVSEFYRLLRIVLINFKVCRPGIPSYITMNYLDDVGNCVILIVLANISSNLIIYLTFIKNVMYSSIDVHMIQNC